MRQIGASRGYEFGACVRVDSQTYYRYIYISTWHDAASASRFASESDSVVCGVAEGAAQADADVWDAVAPDEDYLENLQCDSTWQTRLK